MPAIDYKKEFKQFYNPSPKEAVLVTVPPIHYLMIDGTGDPNTAPAYKEAVESLYSLAYSLKFMLKKGVEALDYAVMPLEGQWWVEAEHTTATVPANRDSWHWTMMIMQPNAVTPEHVAHAKAEVRKKKGLGAVEQVRYELLDEGPAAQIMHVGPYSAEQPTIERLHHYIETHGYVPRGKHHEIYLSDPRRSAPEKMHTILRMPVSPA